MTEREATEELEALTTLCRQLESWREETESDLTVSQRMSDKMRAEKRALADEKRQLVRTLLCLSHQQTVFRTMNEDLLVILAMVHLGIPTHAEFEFALRNKSLTYLSGYDHLRFKQRSLET